MTTWIIWLIVAAVLVIIEILSQMVWTLCLAIGCAAALAASLSGIGLPGQLACMAGASVVAYLVLVPWFRRVHNRMAEREGAAARTGMDALIGKEAIVTETIMPGALGRVKTDGDNWQARTCDNAGCIAAGERVRILSYDSIILTVEHIG